VINTAAGVFALTAPKNPRAGGRFGVVDGAASFTLHNCTINPNGRQINASVQTLVLAVSGFAGRWWFRPDTGAWTPEADWTASSVIPFPDSLIAYLPFMLAVVLSAQYGADVPNSVVAAAVEGRAAFARAYARRGKNALDASFGITGPAQPPQQAG
jgi:hypothetical protein